MPAFNTDRYTHSHSTVTNIYLHFLLRQMAICCSFFLFLLFGNKIRKKMRNGNIRRRRTYLIVHNTFMILRERTQATFFIDFEKEIEIEKRKREIERPPRFDTNFTKNTFCFCGWFSFDCSPFATSRDLLNAFYLVLRDKRVLTYLHTHTHTLILCVSYTNTFDSTHTSAYAYHTKTILPLTDSHTVAFRFGVVRGVRGCAHAYYIIES